MIDLKSEMHHPVLAQFDANEPKYRSFRLTLTPREKEILELIAQGYLNKQIAYQFHVTEQTVKNSLSEIFKKLGVQNRTEAAILTIRLGGFL